MLQKLTATVLALSFFISGFAQGTDSTKTVAVDSGKKNITPGNNYRFCGCLLQVQF